MAIKNYWSIELKYTLDGGLTWINSSNLEYPRTRPGDFRIIGWKDMLVEFTLGRPPSDPNPWGMDSDGGKFLTYSKISNLSGEWENETLLSFFEFQDNYSYINMAHKFSVSTCGVQISIVTSFFSNNSYKL